MNFIQYVENLKQQQRGINIQQLREEIEAPWVEEKINNHIQRFGGMFTKEQIKTAINNDNLIASFFCKDPNKQNISEMACAQVLKLAKLPANGKNSVRFDSSGNIVHTALGNSKSADFYYNGYYMTQKYTMCSGGAQDNQRNDVIDFLTKGAKKYKVGAILDGDYWAFERPKLKQIFKDNPNILITSVEELVNE